MKQKALLLLSLLFTALLTSCTHVKVWSLTTIQAADIESITLLSLLPEDIVEIKDSVDLHKLIETLQNIPLHHKMTTSVPFDDSLVQYTLRGNHHTEITISIQSPYVCINEEWYLSELSACEQLKEEANALFH